MNPAARGAGRLRGLTTEGLRYLAASAGALIVDFGIYLWLIYFARLHYLVAAPIGFLAGLLFVYLASVRWVFFYRRVQDPRLEFVLFSMIGVMGVALNELILYAGVEAMALSYAAAKAVSAGLVFGFNFGLRKVLLFRRR